MGAAIMVLGFVAVVAGLIGFKANQKHADEDLRLQFQYGRHAVTSAASGVSSAQRLAMWQRLAWAGVVVALAGLGTECAFRQSGRNRAAKKPGAGHAGHACHDDDCCDEERIEIANSDAARLTAPAQSPGRV